MKIGIQVARTILTGDITAACRLASRSAWSVAEARAIAGACREANRRWGCTLAFEQFCAAVRA